MCFPSTYQYRGISENQYFPLKSFELWELKKLTNTHEELHSYDTLTMLNHVE